MNKPPSPKSQFVPRTIPQQEAWEVHQALVRLEVMCPNLHANALWKQHRDDAYEDLQRAMGVRP